ncbi:MAG: hypothetical protein QXY51_01650 [Candidatus Bathyarchaeia archaeon]
MEEKEQKLKLVDVSFIASLKFWLAYLIVQIVAFVIIFGIMAVFMLWTVQSIRGIIPSFPTIDAILAAIIH